MIPYWRKSSISLIYRTVLLSLLLIFFFAAQSIITVEIIHAASLYLTWNPNDEEDLRGYKIYYSTSPRNYTVDVGNVTEYKLEDLDLHEDVIYYIAITAYDTSGNESDFSTELDYFADDRVPYGADNCPDTYNPDQDDNSPPQGNGIGDACDCEGDFDCDGAVDMNDIREFLLDFGRGMYDDSCANDSCNGDFNCDGAVASDDIIKMLEDFGRNFYNNPCPDCVGRDWCSY
jgi:hypothetical protein